MAASPCSVTPRKLCGELPEMHASMATCTPPSLPFLKPQGKDIPDTSSLGFEINKTAFRDRDGVRDKSDQG
jgi:hypothetical protein